MIDLTYTFDSVADARVVRNACVAQEKRARTIRDRPHVTEKERKALATRAKRLSQVARSLDALIERADAVRP